MKYYRRDELLVVVQRFLEIAGKIDDDGVADIRSFNKEHRWSGVLFSKTDRTAELRALAKMDAIAVCEMPSMVRVYGREPRENILIQISVPSQKKAVHLRFRQADEGYIFFGCSIGVKM